MYTSSRFYKQMRVFSYDISLFLRAIQISTAKCVLFSLQLQRNIAIKAKKFVLNPRVFGTFGAFKRNDEKINVFNYCC